MRLRFFGGIVFAAALAFAGCGSQGQGAAGLPAVTEVAVAGDVPAPQEAIVRETSEGPVHATVNIAPARPVLGDQITLRIEVDAEPGVNVTMPEFGDQLGRFNIAGFRPSERVLDDGRLRHAQEYTLDVPRSGKLRMPSFLVEFTDSRPGIPDADPSAVHELLTEEISFEVQSVLPEGSVTHQLGAPIDELPEIVFEEERRSNVWLILLAVLAAAGAVAFVLARKRAPAAEQPPHVIAFQALDALERDGIPSEAAALDEWHFRLSNIVREYVERRFSLHAPRLTTEEFFEKVRSGNELDGDNQAMICKFLQRADRIKFSEFVPSEQESMDMLKEARVFVEKTKPAEIAPAGVLEGGAA